jgi:hypothetical protein
MPLQSDSTQQRSSTHEGFPEDVRERTTDGPAFDRFIGYPREEAFSEVGKISALSRYEALVATPAPRKFHPYRTAYAHSTQRL